MGSPDKNTGVGCHSLLQGIFPTQGSNLHLLCCGHILYHLTHMATDKMSVGPDHLSCRKSRKYISQMLLRTERKEGNQLS